MHPKSIEKELTHLLQYIFIRDPDDLLSDEPEIFTAEDQCWDEETLRQLREEYNIVFMTNGDGVTPIMVSDRWGIVLGHEDDGTIQFRYQVGQPEMCFGKIWVEDLIADLREACRLIEAGVIHE